MSEWISVKDKLPVDSREIVIINSYGTAQLGYFLEDDEHDCFVDYLTRPISDVSHWMYLPSPPEEP